MEHPSCVVGLRVSLEVFVRRGGKGDGTRNGARRGGKEGKGKQEGRDEPPYISF